MIFNDDGTNDSMSEGEMEALENVAMHRQVNEDEDDQVFCDEDSSPALVVSKVLTLQHQQDEDQRCHIFHTKAGINGRSVKVIIDGGSCHNLASEELCSKLHLVKMKHPHPYKVQMAKRLPHYPSRAYGTSFLQDRSLRRHFGV